MWAVSVKAAQSEVNEQPCEAVRRWSAATDTATDTDTYNQRLA